MVTRYCSEIGKYVYFVNPIWTSLLGSNDSNFDKDGGIVFDEIIEKANTDYNILSPKSYRLAGQRLLSLVSIGNSDACSKFSRLK
jgi:hypothetical protein